jgi:hypothetical protein
MPQSVLKCNNNVKQKINKNYICIVICETKCTSFGAFSRAMVHLVLQSTHMVIRNVYFIFDTLRIITFTFTD